MRALSLLLLIACTDRKSDTAPGDTVAPPSDSGPGDSVAGDDTGRPPPPPYPWSDSSFWTDPGPLEPLFGTLPDTSDTTMKFLLRHATSPDLTTWTAAENPIMDGLNSLDIMLTQDGIILTGLVQPGRGATIGYGAVYGVQTSDLVTWGSHEWSVNNLDGYNNLVDPSLHLRLDGAAGLAYYRTNFDDTGDPAWTEGPHNIYRAVWSGSSWENAELAYAEEYLADPVICKLKDVEYLFVTHEAKEVRVAKGNGDGTFTALMDATWADRTVPFCRTEDDGSSIMLLSQGLGPNTDVRTARFDGTTTEELGLLYEDDLFPEGGCSAPVVTHFLDQWVLFCAIDWQGYLRGLGLIEDTGAIPGGG